MGATGSLPSGVSANTSVNFRTSSSSLFRDDASAKFRLSDSRAAKFGKISAGCNFRDYMEQQHGDSGEMWRSSSTPTLPEIKKGPSLPQLVKKTANQKSSGINRASTGSQSSTALGKTAPLFT